MRNIEVAVLNEAHDCPAGMMMFLAKLTQRGHNIHCMDDLMKLYNDSIGHHKTAVNVANLPHGTIKRFTPITVAIVGASRRFLAQARTHQVGFNYVSASLQYSDYSGQADFVVPYELIKTDHEIGCPKLVPLYLDSCKKSMKVYEYLAADTDNDTAGYAAPQGLRNILIMQANHEAWMHFIRLRGCNRNTVETQYVTMRIWEELLKTEDGKEMFHFAGPDCMYGVCREGKMCCGNTLNGIDVLADANGVTTPRMIINKKWPLLKEDKYMYKNREDLLKELEDVKADRDEALECARKSEEHIRDLHTELEELKKVESMKEDCDVTARQLKIMYDSFVDAGFTDSQAFGLLTSIIPAILNPATVQAPSVDQFIRGMLL